MSKIRKIILGSLMCAATTATLVSTTYAYSLLRKEATTQLDFNLESEAGILMSLDGVNFTQGVTSSEVFSYIEQNTGVDYETLTLPGVSVKHNNLGELSLTDMGMPQFTKDYLLELGSTELPDNFKPDIVPSTTTVPSTTVTTSTATTTASGLTSPTVNNPDVKYRHIQVDAAQSDYIMFDIYLKVQNQGENKKTYNLVFDEKTEIRGTAASVTLDNSLVADGITYASKDKIEVNPADAIRVGVVDYSYVSMFDEFAQETKSFYVPGEFRVYEPNEGLGSAAIEGSTDPKHDKENNAMYTYYNNLFPFHPMLTAAQDGVAFDTLDTFTGEDDILGVFQYNDDKMVKDYNVIKLTMYVWLEGWDADYFMGIPIESKNIGVNLVYKMVEAE